MSLLTATPLPSITSAFSNYSIFPTPSSPTAYLNSTQISHDVLGFTTDNITDIANSTTTTRRPRGPVNSTTTTRRSRSPVKSSWLYLIPGPFICAFGILCNILNLCVLSQKELHESPYTYLMFLSISDLGLLSVSLLHLVTSSALGTMFKAVLDAYVFFAIGNIFFNSSVWIIVLLTIERMCFVMRPLTFRPSRKKAFIGIFLVFFVCVLINIPKFMCYRIGTFKGAYYPFGTDFKNGLFMYRFSWFHAIMINFVPLIVLIVTNTTLIHALKKAGKQRGSLRSNHDKMAEQNQRRLTRTLIAVVILFFVCVFPSAFVDDPIAYALFGGDRTWQQYLRSPANQSFIYVCNLLLFVNSSLNFILYCAFNKKFRSSMKKFFRKVYNCKNGRHFQLTYSDARDNSHSRSFETTVTSTSM